MRVLILCLALLAAGLAPASALTPREIQGQIAAGQAPVALSELQGILQTHPDSGVAWYLTAEAQDAVGNKSAARDALGKAEQFSPGLPFANAQDLAALRSHLAGGGHGFGLSPVVLVIGGLFVLFLALRLFGRRRVAMGYPGGYGAPPPGYGPGYRPEGGFGGGGGGLGSSLISGLAAGAGFAAGERIIDDFTGRPRETGFDDGPTLPPARDDGLQGDPGWDDSGGNNDPNDGW
jgi:hypothetical protein